jgi:hypothetical protein
MDKFISREVFLLVPVSGALRVHCDIQLFTWNFTSVADLDPVRSEPFWSDPDLDPGLNKWSYIKFFGVCKIHKYLLKESLFLNFLNFRSLVENLYRSGSGRF